MKKYTHIIANGKTIELDRMQMLELKRDGMVIVGDRIIRTAAYCEKVEKSTRAAVMKAASRMFR